MKKLIKRLFTKKTKDLHITFIIPAETVEKAKAKMFLPIITPTDVMVADELMHHLSKEIHNFFFGDVPIKRKRNKKIRTIN